MFHTSQKIFAREEVPARLAVWRLHGDRIVFTNGCFDLLHLGHVDYLEQARHLGDRLVLGLNTDASIRRLKGATRPIQDEQSRARVMAALEFVDLVTLFDEDTPRELIQLVRPEVLVKGNDYRVEDIVGAREVMAAGGVVRTIPLVEGHSTSYIVNKIRHE
ncbi:MAG: D-glycero-beta-D-manno-heptose 1-phosphate adenylyltransferase [Bacteroidota bacterium]